MEDGKTLLYAVTQNGVGNLWAQPIERGPGHQMTNFSSDRIQYYQVTPGGKKLLLISYHNDSDVFLLRDTTAP